MEQYSGANSAVVRFARASAGPEAEAGKSQKANPESSSISSAMVGIGLDQSIARAAPQPRQRRAWPLVA